MKHHLLLKPSQSLQLDRLDPNVESTIMANKIEQMRQQLQMNGTSHSNSAAMSKDNKTAEMKKKQQLGKRYSGIWGGKWSYEEIEEKPEPPPNEFEYLGLRPRKMPQQLMPPPPIPKPKPNQKLMATKSIAPGPGEGTLKQSWSDSILANRRWSMENPEHLLKEQQQPQFKAPAPPTTSTKMPAKLPGPKPNEPKLQGRKPNEPKLQGPKPNEEEENMQQMKEKGQNEENAGESANREKEGGIIEKEQPVEPKKRGSPKGNAATNKKKNRGTKGGRKTKKEEEKILAEGNCDEEEEKVAKRQYKPRVKRVYWEYVWEPVPEPVVKKPRKQGPKKDEDGKVVKEKLADVAEQQQLELEPKEQPKIEPEPKEAAEQVQQNEPIVEAMDVEVSQKQQNELNEEQPKEVTIQIQKQRELPFVPMLEVIEENIVEAEEQHQKDMTEREEDGEIRGEDLANEEEEKEEASFGSKEYVSETSMEEEEEEKEEGVAKMNGMNDISNERRHIQQQEDEYEEEDDEVLPVIPVVDHPSSPPPPPQSSTSPSTPDSRANPNELDAELAMIAKPRPLHVDRDGYLTCRKNSIINDRFYVERELGDGVFSNVYLVLDRQDNAKKAMKIIRNTQEYMAAAEEEIEVLNYFDENDPQKKEQLVIRILETFQVEPIDRFGHHCILLPLYGKDVFTFMKDNKYHPFPLDQIRYMAYQLIHATNFLHSIHLTHTDLKPENILFVNSTKFVHKKPWHKPQHPYDTDKDYKPGKKIKVLQDASIRLCDMGSAVYDDQPTRDRCVSTRHYRAPEAILEIGWDHSCDVWSLGCIFFELYAGHFLIPQVDDLTHLTILEKVFGIDALPMWMRRLTKKPDLFNNRFKLLKRQKEERGWDIDDTKPLKSYIHEDHQGDPDHEALFDLIAQMLIHDPKMRVKLATAQNHEFFNSLEPALRAKVDRGGWDEDNDVQPRNHRNKIYPSKNRQPQNGNIAENGYHWNGNGGGAGPSHK